MKQSKLLLTIFLLITVESFSQDLQSIKGLIASNDYQAARGQVDLLLSDKKQQAQAAPWFYKARIYTEVVRRQDSVDSDLLHEALKSYIKYQQLDPQNTLMAADNNVDLFQLYDISYSIGEKHYNTENYRIAFRNFRTALETEEYIVSKKFAFNGKHFPLLDTQLLVLTGFSAYLSGNEEAAIPYFMRLADLRLSGIEFKGVYTALYQHFNKKNEGVKAAKYLATGRQVFDDEDYWIKLELGNPRNAKDRLERYEQMVQKYPSNSKLGLNLAIELFNYVYAEQKPADHTQKQERLQELLTRLVKQDSSSALAFYMLSQHVLNQLYDLEDQARDIDVDSPGGESKKKTSDSRINQKYEELLTSSLKAFELFSESRLTTGDREKCKKLLEQLINCYQRKKLFDKADFYREKLQNL